MIKPENKRITITINPNQDRFLKELMKKQKMKTYGKAIEYIIDIIIVLGIITEGWMKEKSE